LKNHRSRSTEGNLAQSILDMAFTAQEGHIPSALSILTLVSACFTEFKFQETNHEFILSKGHGCLALYAVLANEGVLSKNELNEFCQFTGRLGGHPDSAKVPTVVTSTGSLGHGLPFGCGMAAAKKASGDGSGFVIVLIGDGECNEGTTWESALLASQLELGNLVCVVDYNHSGDRAIDLDGLDRKWQSFGWRTEVIDGHCVSSVKDTLKSATISDSRPTVVIANTIKGKGIKEMENNPAWHHSKLSHADYLKFSRELLR